MNVSYVHHLYHILSSIYNSEIKLMINGKKLLLSTINHTNFCYRFKFKDFDIN